MTDSHQPPAGDAPSAAELGESLKRAGQLFGPTLASAAAAKRPRPVPPLDSASDLAAAVRSPFALGITSVRSAASCLTVGPATPAILRPAAPGLADSREAPRTDHPAPTDSPLTDGSPPLFDIGAPGLGTPASPSTGFDSPTTLAVALVADPSTPAPGPAPALGRSESMSIGQGESSTPATASAASLAELVVPPPGRDGRTATTPDELVPCQQPIASFHTRPRVPILLSGLMLQSSHPFDSALFGPRGPLTAGSAARTHYFSLAESPATPLEKMIKALAYWAIPGLELLPPSLVPRLVELLERSSATGAGSSQSGLLSSPSGGNLASMAARGISSAGGDGFSLVAAARSLPSRDREDLSFYMSKRAEWQQSFQSVYLLFRQRKVEYFFYQASALTVVFFQSDGSPSDGGAPSFSALISRSTPGLQRMLSAEGVPFALVEKPPTSPAQEPGSESQGVPPGGRASASGSSQAPLLRPAPDGLGNDGDDSEEDEEDDLNEALADLYALESLHPGSVALPSALRPLGGELKRRKMALHPLHVAGPIATHALFNCILNSVDISVFLSSTALPPSLEAAGRPASQGPLPPSDMPLPPLTPRRTGSQPGELTRGSQSHRLAAGSGAFFQITPLPTILAPGPFLGAGVHFIEADMRQGLAPGPRRGAEASFASPRRPAGVATPASHSRARLPRLFTVTLRDATAGQAAVGELATRPATPGGASTPGVTNAVRGGTGTSLLGGGPVRARMIGALMREFAEQFCIHHGYDIERESLATGRQLGAPGSLEADAPGTRGRVRLVYTRDEEAESIGGAFLDLHAGEAPLSGPPPGW
ncbi:hypothetical protein H696_00489 [Fonticula alba]|uniref:Uncharacterized protein n=1 Tax=Fonticula alba TaxID=691883 RepID=A0A058ZET4_FONAL|nr:hypothetical protein H696_00489 [Fonticula alba]KCV72925.1 hypothetical protein H696_00489 [Fonticula alba]|eukprot:XP_009492626.1 hypothetical protein H696_00489 [Fonticula alba]